MHYFTLKKTERNNMSVRTTQLLSTPHSKFSFTNHMKFLNTEATKW